MDRTILAIKRQYSRIEKYRLFLRHMLQVEEELANERRKHTDKIIENADLKNKIQSLEITISKLQPELDAFRKKQSRNELVTKEQHDKVLKERNMWRDKFMKLQNEYLQLKIKLDKANANSQTGIQK